MVRIAQDEKPKLHPFLILDIFVMEHVERWDFAAELFSRNRWKQASKDKENDTNFWQYFIYNACLRWSISMNKESFWTYFEIKF